MNGTQRRLTELSDIIWDWTASERLCAALFQDLQRQWFPVGLISLRSHPFTFPFLSSVFPSFCLCFIPSFLVFFFFLFLSSVSSTRILFTSFPPFFPLFHSFRPYFIPAFIASLLLFFSFLSSSFSSCLLSSHSFYFFPFLSSLFPSFRPYFIPSFLYFLWPFLSFFLPYSCYFLLSFFLPVLSSFLVTLLNLILFFPSSSLLFIFFCPFLPRFYVFPFLSYFVTPLLPSFHIPILPSFSRTIFFLLLI